jgi:ATP-dependent RNA helicase DeaD
MDQFREGHINILVATDLAARGIDVKEISYVVNYHLPDAYESYVHRSGRTAESRSKGLSLTVLQEEEVQEIADFEKNWESNSQNLKPSALSIEENNTLWANKYSKPNPTMRWMN